MAASARLGGVSTAQTVEDVVTDLHLVPAPAEDDLAADCPSTPACLRARQGRLELLSRPHEGGLATRSELVAHVRADLTRYAGRASLGLLVKHWLVTPQFKCTTWTRVCGYLRRQPLLKPVVYPVAKAYLLRLRHKYGVVIADYADLGPGLYLTRFGGVYLNGDTVIGKNVNISPMVLLGQTNRGKRMGSPVIGDRVFLAPGCKVVGHVHVGDDVAVGSNAVVTRDVPAGAVVAGVPATVLSVGTGSRGYINRQADV